MRYFYYPGCSLTESAKEYDISSRVVLERLGAELTDIPDWTCCGASAVEAVSRLLTYVLPARNLALAEKEGAEDVLIPCSACYLNHLRVAEDLPGDRELTREVNQALEAEGLSYAARNKVRHLLDVLAADFDVEQIAEQVTASLEGLKVAPYYGCQALRPYVRFDDPERPTTMAPIIKALGAECLDWDKGASCCGASLMATKPKAALASVAGILDAAAAGEADVIATICPMCQMNLDGYQDRALAQAKTSSKISILYLPQLMGLAFGMGEAGVALGKNMVVTSGFRRKAPLGAVKAG